jgi:hypothetical protein
MRLSGNVLRLGTVLAIALAGANSALAGPPFLSDDPDPTPFRHFEIYIFADGAFARGADAGDAGVDFNYGAGPDLQLTGTIPFGFEREDGAGRRSGLGNIELAAKFRFLHQESFGWDVAVFPRVILPSGSNIGDDHASLLLPVWIGQEWDDGSTFGGGGCVINRGGDSQDYCIAGWALTHRFLPNLQIGAELYHEGADTRDGFASTILGLGATYDASETLHVLGYVGAGLENAAETGREIGYVSALFTF